MIERVRILLKKQLRRLKRFILRYFLEFRSTEHVFTAIIAVLIGVAGGCSAIAIQQLIKVFEELFWGVQDFQPELIAALPVYQRLLIPAFGGLAVGLIVYYFAREAKGHGVPEVMQAIARKNGIIRPRVAFIKLLVSSLYIGAGGSTGREGPVIQIGASIGSSIGQLLRVNPQRMKIFVACGASAGIAAAFNTPIAGAIFSMEIILGDFAAAQFTPIVISSVIATAVSRGFLGNFPAFEIPRYELTSPYELIFYAVLGFLAGFVSLLYIKSLYFVEDFFERLKIHEVIKPLIGGLIIGVMGIMLPQIYGVGYHSIVGALHGELVWSTLFILIFAKIVATSISLGSGGSGGVFAPSLFIGTMAGGFFGSLVHHFFPFSGNSGAYALVGMGALVSGTTHAPLTAILMIFEMTNDYKIILPLMIACAISTLVAGKFQKASIYTLKLLRRGIDWSEGRDANVLSAIPVKDVMEDDAVTVSANTPLSDLIELFYNSRYSQIFVVDMQGHLTGRINTDDIRWLLREEKGPWDIIIAYDLMQPNVAQIHVSDTLDDVMRLFGRYSVEQLPVVDSESGNHLVGTVFYKNVIAAYNQQLVKQNFVREMGANIKLLEKSREVGFGDHLLMEIAISGSLAGKTLQELDLRQRYGINILIVKCAESGDADTYQVPRPDELLRLGDKLVVMGTRKNLEKLKHL